MVNQELSYRRHSVGRKREIVRNLTMVNQTCLLRNARVEYLPV
jgi:hypothetical protein